MRPKYKFVHVENISISYLKGRTTRQCGSQPAQNRQRRDQM